MPRFEIVGFGRETGRKRVRIYEAKDEEQAILMAASDGTVVDKEKTRILPAPPATERQIEYAKDLGIKIPKNPTRDELSKLIDRAVEEDWPTKKQIQKARRLGINIPKGITGDDLEDLIFDCEDEREDKKVQTIEKTGKGYKGAMLIGLLMILIGIAAACGGESWGLFIAFLGALLGILAKICAWWEHG